MNQPSWPHLIMIGSLSVRTALTDRGQDAFWRWLADPLNLTAVATGVLAVLAAIALVANILLTAVSWRATRVQLRELELFERQLRLAEAQAKSASALAKPEIRAEVTKKNNKFVEGHIHWSHGTSPAYDIHVWVKLPDGRLLMARVRYIAPADRPAIFVAGELAAQSIDCPFEAFFAAPPQPGEYRLGVTWVAADGAFWGYSEKVIEEHHGTDDEGRPVTFGLHRVPGPDPEMAAGLS